MGVDIKIKKSFRVGKIIVKFTTTKIIRIIVTISMIGIILMIVVSLYSLISL